MRGKTRKSYYPLITAKTIAQQAQKRKEFHRHPATDSWYWGGSRNYWACNILEGRVTSSSIRNGGHDRNVGQKLMSLLRD